MRVEIFEVENWDGRATTVLLLRVVSLIVGLIARLPAFVFITSSPSLITNY